MKYNKGFIGIGIIIAIVATLVVGGGAVYFATKTPTSPKNIGENNYQPQENQNDVSNIPVQNTVTNNTANQQTQNNNPLPSITWKTYTQLGKFSFKYDTRANITNENGTYGIFYRIGDNLNEGTDTTTINYFSKGIPSGAGDCKNMSTKNTVINGKTFIYCDSKAEPARTYIYKEGEKTLVLIVNNLGANYIDLGSVTFLNSVSEESIITKNDVTNQPAYLKSVYVKNGKNYIDVDYIQMFATIDEQKKAKFEDGGCSDIINCEVYNNGYKRNTNPLIRTFEVSPSVLINVYGEYNQYLNNGDLDSSKSLITFSQLKDFSNRQGDYKQYIVLDVKNNTVIKIIEPYQE